MQTVARKPIRTFTAAGLNELMFGTKDPPSVCKFLFHSNRKSLTEKLANTKSFNILKSFSFKGIGIVPKGSGVAPAS